MVKYALERIREGVVAAGKRAAISVSSLPPISPRNLLEGTFLRFDTQDSGALDPKKLLQVTKNGRHTFATTAYPVLLGSFSSLDIL